MTRVLTPIPCRLKTIAEHVGGILLDPRFAEVVVQSVRGLSEADVHSLSYVDDARALAQISEANPVGALLVPEGTTECARPAVSVKNPRLAFARALALVHPAITRTSGVHPTADVHPTATVHPTACVGPYCHLEAGVVLEEGVVLVAHVHVGANSEIARGTEIRPRVYVGAGVHIGQECLIHANTMIGWAAKGPGHGVQIGDNVEVGARAVIEAGSERPTIIGSGTRTDNLIHVGAGAHLGPHCLLVSMSHVARNAVLEHHVTLAGQAMVLEGRRVGAISIVGARGKVDRDLPARTVVSGDPAVPHKEELRRVANTMKLAKLVPRLERILASY